MTRCKLEVDADQGRLDILQQACCDCARANCNPERNCAQGQIPPQLRSGPQRCKIEGRGYEPESDREMYQQWMQRDADDAQFQGHMTSSGTRRRSA
jgi:hypothetical protein